MARTWHHGDKAKLRLFEGVEWGVRMYDVTVKQKRPRSHAGWNWCGSNPGNWTRTMMTPTQRATTRLLLRKTERLQDYEDAPLFPLAKKPMLYYW